MGNVESWPVASQLVSAVKAAGGDLDGARRTQENFTKGCPVISQIRSAAEAMAGDTAAAKETQRYFLQENLEEPAEKRVRLEREELMQMATSAGVEFPGCSEKPTDRANWIGSLGYGFVRLRDLVLPGTHRSGTAKIGLPVSRLLWECQPDRVAEQLRRGVRALDVRVGTDGRVCHGEMKHKDYSAADICREIITFLRESPEEIVLVTFSTEIGYADPPAFDKFLEGQFKDLLIRNDSKVFQKLLRDLSPGRVICFWNPRTDPDPPPGALLWPHALLRVETGGATQFPREKFDNNLTHLGVQTSLRDPDRIYFSRVELVCKPKLTLGKCTVRSMSERIKPFARLFLAEAHRRGQLDRVQIISEDFIDDDLIDACYGISFWRTKNWP